jgi:hypothetical protein
MEFGPQPLEFNAADKSFSGGIVARGSTAHKLTGAY